MIEVRMERVINRYGNMGLRIRKIKALTRAELPEAYAGANDVRCMLIECGSIPAMMIGGIKGRNLPSPWDLDDEARQTYMMEHAYLQTNSEPGIPCTTALLGFMYEAGCNLMISRNPADLFEPDPGLDIWKMELLLHLSPTKDGIFDEKDWKGYVTVKI